MRKTDLIGKTDLWQIFDTCRFQRDKNMRVFMIAF